MPVNIAINGFGRIGRALFRNASGKTGVRVAAINDLAEPRVLAHLLKYDSVLGRYPGRVTAGDGEITVDSVSIPVFCGEDPATLPWKAMNIDVAVECTGLFTGRRDAARHLSAGAASVLISASSPDADATLVLGVNEQTFDPKAHRVISNASCTTNCVAPVLAVLNGAFGVESASLTTIHSYGGDQNLLDNPGPDLTRCRAGALSMVPVSTGAAESVALVMPELRGRILAACVRVPTPSVSLADLTVRLNGSATCEKVNNTLEFAAEGKLKNILGVSREPLVSVDYVGQTHSGIVDATQTRMAGNNLVRVLVWYDNECGYAARLADVAELIGRGAAHAIFEKTSGFPQHAVDL